MRSSIGDLAPITTVAAQQGNPPPADSPFWVLLTNCEKALEGLTCLEISDRRVFQTTEACGNLVLAAEQDCPENLSPESCTLDTPTCPKT